MAKIVFNFIVYCLELTVRFLQFNAKRVWAIGLWIAVKNKSVHCGRPIEYQWIQNGTDVMVRKPPCSFKRLQGLFKRLQN